MKLITMLVLEIMGIHHCGVILQPCLSLIHTIFPSCDIRNVYNMYHGYIHAAAPLTAPRATPVAYVPPVIAAD